MKKININRNSIYIVNFEINITNNVQYRYRLTENFRNRYRLTSKFRYRYRFKFRYRYISEKTRFFLLLNICVHILDRRVESFQLKYERQKYNKKHRSFIKNLYSRVTQSVVILPQESNMPRAFRIYPVIIKQLFFLMKWNSYEFQGGGVRPPLACQWSELFKVVY